MENMKFNIYDLKRVIDQAVEKHESRINSMSDRVSISFNGIGLEFSQICEYPECYPDVTHIHAID